MWREVNYITHALSRLGLNGSHMFSQSFVEKWSQPKKPENYLLTQP
jgi:hypothetical protein